MNEREILKAAWARTDACPDLPMLLDHIERDDSDVKAHLHHCPRCTAEVALFRDVTQGPALNADIRALNQRVTAAISERTGAESRIESWWRRLFRPAILTPALAGLAMVLVMVGIRIQQRPVLVPSENIERARSVEMLAPKGEVNVSPEVLRWSVVTGASSYRVRILEVDRNIIWEATTNATSALVPAPVQKQALPGKRLIWTVEAFNSKGEAVASGTQDFRRTIGRQGTH